MYNIASASTMRWECRIDSVIALRYQLPEICNALDELAEEADDAMNKSESETLYATLKQYKFLVSLVLWYNLLFQANFVIKELQGKAVDLNTAMDSFNNLKQHCHYLCFQETHRSIDQASARIPGMALVGNKYGSSVFIRNGQNVNNISVCEEKNVKVITVELPGLTHLNHCNSLHWDKETSLTLNPSYSLTSHKITQLPTIQQRSPF